MNKSRSFLVLVILALLISSCKNSVHSAKDVQKLVETFGSRLQKVSLSAPPEILEESLFENYGELVTEELLQRWLEDPQKAPGRLVSSPWPDRIDVLSIDDLPDAVFKIQGEIVEITSDGEDFAIRIPIVLSAEVKDEKLVISDVTVGSREKNIVYADKEYGFSFMLPQTWSGYSVLEDKWEGRAGEEIVEEGSFLKIRHPEWKEDEMRQDIPIMIFEHDQWDALQNEDFAVGAAPVGPKELGRNDKYVFALPARYNFEFLKGYEEVEEILEGNPFKAIN